MHAVQLNQSEYNANGKKQTKEESVDHYTIIVHKWKIHKPMLIKCVLIIIFVQIKKQQQSTFDLPFVKQTAKVTWFSLL